MKKDVKSVTAVGIVCANIMETEDSYSKSGWQEVFIPSGKPVPLELSNQIRVLETWVGKKVLTLHEFPIEQQDPMVQKISEALKLLSSIPDREKVLRFE